MNATARPPIEDPAFTFAIDRLQGIDLKDFAAFFDDLPVDHFIEGDFRRRRLSRFTAAGEHLPHASFMQSGYVNRLLGNIQRDYAELDDELIATPAFRGLLRQVVDFFPLPPATVLGVHQIRIVCGTGFAGHPAPEGVHQDGFDYISICCIAREHVAGAETGIFPAPDTEPLLQRVLAPGEVAFCNDRTVYHYTAPLHPDGAAQGHRDVFVLTAALPGDEKSLAP